MAFTFETVLAITVAAALVAIIAGLVAGIWQRAH